MFQKLFGKDYQRRQLLAKVTTPVMQTYLSKPFPNKKEWITNIDIVSLDFETTGLDPDKDRIVSIGLVEVERLGIKLDSCWHQVISTNKELSAQSVVIHQITDDQSVEGMSIEKAIPKLLERLRGKVMLVHNARVEQGFINKICQTLYGSDFVIPIIDTQFLAKRSLDRSNQHYKNNDLRLFNLRKNFNMPAYKAHNALMDAIATAELFLAMVNNIAPNKNGKLADFLS
jgi:DNA polymerase-3 subunit epsilon